MCGSLYVVYFMQRKCLRDQLSGSDRLIQVMRIHVNYHDTAWLVEFTKYYGSLKVRSTWWLHCWDCGQVGRQRSHCTAR